MSASTLVLAMGDLERLIAPRLGSRADTIACRPEGGDVVLAVSGFRLGSWLPRCDPMVRVTATLLPGQVLELRFRVVIDGIAGALLAAAQRLGGGRAVAQALVDACGVGSGLRWCDDSRLEIDLVAAGAPSWCRIDQIGVVAAPPAIACAFTILA